MATTSKLNGVVVRLIHSSRIHCGSGAGVQFIPAPVLTILTYDTFLALLLFLQQQNRNKQTKRHSHFWQSLLSTLI